MKAVFISDIHLALRLPMANLDQGGTGSDRLRDTCDVLLQAGLHAASIDGVLIIVGDLFDVKRPSGATLIAASQTLKRIADEGVMIYILPGNHDALDGDGRMYNLQLYNELDIPNIHVLGHEYIEVSEGSRIHALPWLPEGRARRRIRKRAGKLSGGDRDILILHQTMAGAIGDSGWVCDKGIKGDLMRPFELCISGHYHKPQEHDWGMYLGSPLHLTFAEGAVTDRGFWELDLDQEELEPKLVVPNFPLFVTDQVDLEDGDLLDDVYDLADAADGASYFRLILTGSRESILRSRRLVGDWRSKLDQMGLRGLKVDERPTKEVNSRLKLKKPVFTLGDAMRAYTDQYGPGNLDKSDLLVLGQKLLKESKDGDK